MLSGQEKKELKQQIKSNQHEVFVVSIEEMDAIVRSSPKGRLPHIQNAWVKLKGKAETGASYYASADDLRTLSKLVGDLGGFATKAYIKTYGGKPHIILKGHPGLRAVLTGTKYGIQNPKVLLSVYRVADYFLTDQATLSQLIGSLATDIVKIGIATGASIAAASVVSAAFTIAIGPIVAVVIVGVATSMFLSAIDERYGVTGKVIAGLDEIDDDINSYIERTKQNIQQGVASATSEIIDYVLESAMRIALNSAKHTIEKFMSQAPRVYK